MKVSLDWALAEGNRGRRSADLDPCVGEELVLGDGEVQRRRSLPDAAGRVVDRAVARAEPAFVFALVPERHAAEMRADADDDQPFRLLDARLVGLRIAELGKRGLLGVLDFLLRPVADEDRPAAELDGDDLAFLDLADIHLDRG